MKFGITLPYGDARATAVYARDAEQAGWDAVFVGDAVWTADPLIQLTAAAMTTSRIRLGTMVLAVPLRTPWGLASQSLAIDLLSEGRLILGLATGATWMGWQGFPNTPKDTRTRAEMLDETIDILTRMHQSQQFDYNGKHFQILLSQVDPMHYPPPTVSKPRVPLWVVGAWPRMKSMRRALKCDGLLPAKMNEEGQFVDVMPEDVREMKTFIDANRTLTSPFDIVVEGKTGAMDPDQTRDILQKWAAAGVTWWVESMWGVPDEAFAERLRQGPPRMD